MFSSDCSSFIGSNLVLLQFSWLLFAILSGFCCCFAAFCVSSLVEFKFSFDALVLSILSLSRQCWDSGGSSLSKMKKGKGKMNLAWVGYYCFLECLWSALLPLILSALQRNCLTSRCGETRSISEPFFRHGHRNSKRQYKWDNWFAFICNGVRPGQK